ncbi:glycosyltransferase family 4 protein [Ornithinimicrobium flavum]|uniref:glycosyltransferase family 4 protein n=1 Tax=Ornithinimicrobium flavum TaxID=1288636 RepID=UPI0023AF6530|nr:glycosyltransferase family 4 protein [Ornithinimicrobium flavum]
MTFRVAYVCADPGIPVFGTKGASVHVQEIVRAWRARGADVHVYAVRLGDDVPADLADLPVHLVRVGGKGLDPAQREVAQQEAAAELARQVVELAPDVVYERYSLFSTVLEQARLGLGSAVRTVLEVNAQLVDEQRTHRVLVDEAGAVAALRAQLAAADVVGCVSEPVADWVRGHAEAWDRIPPVVVVPNGVNTERVRPVTPDPAGPPVVVFVGTLKPWHGVEDLVRAAALAREPWRLRIVGDGPQRETVERLVAEHGLDVELVGAVAPEQVPATMEGASVAVAPYPPPPPRTTTSPR